MSEQPAERTEWIRRVLRDHEAPLLRYAIRLTGDAETARDIVQETLLRLCRADAQTIDGHVGPWLFRVCRQRALDQQRKEQRMPITTTNGLETCPAQAPSPAERNENDEQGQDILRLLTTLSAHQQEVVRLKFQAGLGYRQIAEVTGLTVTNVGYLLHTALAKLREQMTTAADLPASKELAAPKIAPLKSSGLTTSASNEADQPAHEQSGRKG